MTIFRSFKQRAFHSCGEETVRILMISIEKKLTEEKIVVQHGIKNFKDPVNLLKKSLCEYQCKLAVRMSTGPDFCTPY